MSETNVEQNLEREALAALKLDREEQWRPKRRRRWWWLVVLAVASVALVVGRYQQRSPAVAVAEVHRALAAEIGPIPVLSGSGYIVTGERYVSIGVRVPGRIERYFVEEGQTVRKGDPLVQLDDRDYRAQVQRAEAALALARANVELAQADLRRIRALHEQGVVSEQERDQQEHRARVAAANLAQAEAELRQALVNLDYTILRAPTDGVILAKSKEVGEIAVPGGFAGSGDLIRMANLSDLRAQVDINEADLARVFLGQRAWVTPDAYPQTQYAAEVVKFYPQVDRAKGTLRIEVRLSDPDEKLLPDMSARVTFLADPSHQGNGSEPIVLLPSAALRRSSSGENFVWVVDDQRRVRARPVRTGVSFAGRIQVLEGLTGGERVVVSNTPLSEGQAVRLEDEARS
jgi:RND family efflux transporter MFP subunit